MVLFLTFFKQVFFNTNIQNMILQNDGIKLRALEPEDIDLIYKWENNTEIWNVSNTLVPFSRFVISQYIENSARDIYENKQLRLVIESLEKQDAVGAIDIFDFDPFHRRAGIGILIADEKDRQQGYASAALDSMIEFGFNDLGLKQFYCNISVDNQDSLNLFRGRGFMDCGMKRCWTKVGTKWVDEIMLQLIND